MLNELKLTNFRIFDDEVIIRFRPITVLIGRNSSGKSSIIKLILMLHQSMSESGQQFLLPDGLYVSLGFFSNLKNSLTRKNNLMFSLSLQRPEIEPDPSISEYIKSVDKVTKRHDLFYNISGSISYSTKATRGRTNYSLIDRNSGRIYVNIRENLSDNSSFLFPQVRLDDVEAAADFEAFQAAMTKYRVAMAKYGAEHTALDELRHQIRSIYHLSPVRAEFQRVILASNPPAGYVGQSGEYALHHLQRMVTRDREQYSFIVPHLSRVAGIRSVKFETSSGGYVTRAFANNRTTGADVLIADYGFGVGQCLPIFVQGAIMNPYTSLMVEQPEAQLHPTAQLELGSFFADLWNKRKVGSIIETHSDNILLRLRRLISRGDLSHNDVSVAFFTVDEEKNNMPLVKNLDISEDGSMQPGLPMEFFGADVIEGLRLGSKS